MSGMSTLADHLAPSGYRTELLFLDRGVSVDYGELWERGRSVRSWAYASNADSVAMVLSNTEACVTCILGAIRGGLTVVSVPAPPRHGDLDWYRRFVEANCELLGTQYLAVDEQYLALVPPLDGTDATSFEAILGRGKAGIESPEDFQLVQFTSGSTSDPKGIQLPGSKVLANIAAILDRIRPEPGDGTCSWLPLSHDMGLIGMLLTALAGAGQQWARGAQIAVMSPESFVKSPNLWLRACSELGTTITSAPDFGFRMASQRADRSLDLSPLRVCITGGESVRAETLETFASSFHAPGFREEAFCPAYGLAEATLAVTLTSPDVCWRELAIDRNALAQGEVEPQSGGVAVVSAGPPLDGYEILIESAGSGAKTGAITVKGPSLLERYVGDGGSVVDPLEGFATSDVGFLWDQQLYVLGRSDEVFLIGGKKIFATDVELAVCGLTGVYKGRVAAAQDSYQRLVIFGEVEAETASSRMKLNRLVNEMRRAIVNRVSTSPSEVVLLAQHKLPMTTSGKPQKSSALSRLASGELDVLNRYERTR